MKAIFGLVKDDGLWRFDQRVRHFEAPVSGKAVHKDRVAPCSCEKALVHLMRRMAGSSYSQSHTISDINVLQSVTVTLTDSKGASTPVTANR